VGDGGAELSGGTTMVVPEGAGTVGSGGTTTVSEVGAGGTTTVSDDGTGYSGGADVGTGGTTTVSEDGCG
jgi:hypothetical protein